METIEGTTKITGENLTEGMFIRDDIMCRITSLTPVNYDERAAMVEDGNGYVYMIRLGALTEYSIYAWSEEDWAAYRAL